MDIVKRASGNIASCTINDKHVNVAGRSYAKDTPVDFASKKTKPYSLDSVIFYLMNRELPLVAYVEQCKKQDILQVAYLDRVSIENDIANYTETKVPGFFIKPVYTHRKTYNIPYSGQFYYVIIPNDVSCPININTAAFLLSRSPEQPNAPGDAPSFSLQGHTFKLCDEPSQLKDSDWRGVRAIFLSNAKDQLSGWESRFYEAAKKAAVFSFNDEAFKCNKVFIRNEEIANYDEVCDKIMGALSI